VRSFSSDGNREEAMNRDGRDIIFEVINAVLLLLVSGVLGLLMIGLKP
jgi:hypothetical protein